MTPHEAAAGFFTGLTAWLPLQAGITVPVIAGQLPAGVNEAIVLFATGGWQRSDPRGTGAHYPSFQVTAVSPSYASAEALAYVVFGLLNGTGPHVMGGVPVARVFSAQQPFQLAADDRQRHRFVCNYRAVV